MLGLLRLNHFAYFAGYGNIAPTTPGGQVFFMFYAIFGIPIVLLFYTYIGEMLSTVIKRMLIKVEKNWDIVTARLVASVLVLFFTLLFFVVIPAAIFYAIEDDWNYRESLYYTITTLTTVGLGDFTPTTTTVEYQLATAAWLWLGLALVAGLMTLGSGVVEAIGKSAARKCCPRCYPEAPDDGQDEALQGPQLEEEEEDDDDEDRVQIRLEPRHSDDQDLARNRGDGGTGGNGGGNVVVEEEEEDNEVP